MSTEPTPIVTKPPVARTPRRLLGAAVIALVGFGVVNFVINATLTRSQLAQIASKDPAQQSQGVQKLMDRKVLFDALQGGAPPETRLAAVATLEKRAAGGKDKEAFEQLLQMCKDPDTESIEKKTHPVRDAARASVAAVGIDYAERLLDAAKAPDGNIRDGAREALKKIGAPLKEKMAKRLSDGNLRGPMGEMLAAIGPETIPLIAPYLQDPAIKDDPGAKISLIETLGKFKVREAASPLLPFMTDPDPNVRRSVITALANIGVPEGAQVLMTALKSPETDASARAAAAGALGGIGTTEANQAMLEALQDYDTFVAIAAAAGLRRAGDSAAPQIATALQSPNPAIRALAAEAAGGQRSVTLAARALSDREPSVRIRAAQALGDVLLRATAIRQALNSLASARDEKQQDSAVDQLTRFGAEGEVNQVGIPPGAKTNLMAYLTRKRDAETDAKKREPWEKRLANLSAAPVSGLAQPEQLTSLLGALSDKEGAAEAASVALGRLGTVAVDALKTRLASGDETVAYYASKALTAIGRDAVPSLLALASEGNPAARWAAVTLGEIGDPRGLSALETLTKSSDENTAFVAQTALAKVKPG